TLFRSAAKSTVQAALGTDLHLSANAKYSSGWTRYDTSTPSWNFFLSPTADYAGFRRADAGSGTVAWTDLIRITSSGSVGIGTTAPAHMLHVRKIRIPRRRSWFRIIAREPAPRPTCA